MIRPRLSLPIVGLLAMVLSACSSGAVAPTLAPGATTAPAGATQAPAGGAFPCAAIQADVVSAAGNALTKTDFSRANHCEFDFGGTADVPGMDGVVDVRQESSSDLSAVKLGFSNGVDVPSLGDAAYYVSSLSVLYSAFHGHVYAVQLVLFPTTTDEQGLAIAVMKSLLAHV